PPRARKRMAVRTLTGDGTIIYFGLDQRRRKHPAGITDLCAAVVILVYRRRQVTPQLHLIVQDAADLDTPCDNTIYEQVTSPPTAPGNMERTQTRHDLVARFRSSHIGAMRKFADRTQERGAIHSGLARPKVIGRPSENVREIEFSDSAETNAPSWPDHLRSFAPAGNDLFREVIEIGLQSVDAVEFLEFTPIQRAEADTSRFPQSLQPGIVLGLALLHQAQPLTQDFARILVAAGADQLFNDVLVMLRQHNIASRHGDPLDPRPRAAMAYYAIAASGPLRKPTRQANSSASRPGVGELLVGDRDARLFELLLGHGALEEFARQRRQ